jgi:hypothetical protein
MTWLYFVFGQSAFVFVGQTLAMAGTAGGAKGGQQQSASSRLRAKLGDTKIKM